MKIKKLTGLIVFLSCFLGCVLAKAQGLGPVNSVLGIATNGTRTEWKALQGTGTVSVEFSNRLIVIRGNTPTNSTVITNFAGINVTNQIWMPNPGGRAIVADATTKKFSLFNSYTDASNYEEGFLRWEANVLKLGTASAGTGARRSIFFVDNGTNRFGYDVGLQGQAGGNYGSFFVAGGPNGTIGMSPLGNSGCPALTWWSGSTVVADISRNSYLGGSIILLPKTTSQSQHWFCEAGFLLNNSFALMGSSSTLQFRSYSAHTGFGTNCNMLSFGANDSSHVGINFTNNVMSITTANDVNATNVLAVFAPIQRTNWLGGATTITNLVSVGVNGQAGKSITNIWYSVGSDGTGVVTNRQVYLNGLLVSWQQNGSEL